MVLKTVSAQRTCFLHGFGHCSGTFLSEIICLKDCALKQHIGAQTWETAVVLAPWVETDFTHFHNHEIHKTSCTHPQRFHLPCHDMHVIVNNEYVHHLRAAQSMVFFVKTCCPEDEQCRVSSFHASCVK